jgi:hypothetical protein
MLWKSLSRAHSQNNKYSISPDRQLLITLPRDLKNSVALDPRDCSSSTDPTTEYTRNTANPESPLRPSTPEVMPPMMARKMRLDGLYNLATSFWL